MAIDVFVSYHTATSLDTAKAVVQKLESQGLRCWYQDRDSRGFYAEEIEDAIGECGAFVVILHGGSRHVLNEIALAFAREDLEILPLRMTPGALPKGFGYYLNSCHQIDGHSRSRDAALEDLCRRTLRALNRSEIPVETIRYDDGCVYTGQVVSGKRHGRGTMTFADGKIYEGDFVDDKFHGKGKYTWPDGDVYEGDFVEDKFTGKGKYAWPNGDVYEGDWRDDKRTGKGKFTWPSGSVYEGDFVDGKLTGIGTYTYADGRVQYGRWKDNKFLG